MAYPLQIVRNTLGKLGNLQNPFAPVPPAKSNASVQPKPPVIGAATPPTSSQQEPDGGFEALLSYRLNTAKRGKRPTTTASGAITTNEDTFDGMTKSEFVEAVRREYADPGFDKSPWIARAQGQDIAAAPQGSALASVPSSSLRPANVSSQYVGPGKFSGLDSLYQMNPQLRRTGGGLAVPPAAPEAAAAASDAARGIVQRSNAGDVRFASGATITPTAEGTRTLASPFGSGVSTPVNPGQPRPPATFTNMETGQKQTLAEATGGRSTLAPPRLPTPALAGTATATGTPATTPQVSVGKPAGAMAITPTPIERAAGNVASAVGQGTSPSISASAPLTKTLSPPPLPSTFGTFDATRYNNPMHQAVEEARMAQEKKKASLPTPTVRRTPMQVQSLQPSLASSAVGAASNAARTAVTDFGRIQRGVREGIAEPIAAGADTLFGPRLPK
jgi:hypothetical protein